MTPFDQQILDLIQDTFPLVERPYAAIAEMLGSDERTVFETVEKLRASGVIRRIGGVYDSKKLGFISRLCAGKIPASSLDFSTEPHAQTAMEKFAAAVNEIPAITHNYIRSHEYNVWFTVIAENENEIQSIVDRLCDATDIHDVHAMSATRKFKINTVMVSEERRQPFKASDATNEVGHGQAAWLGLEQSESPKTRDESESALRLGSGALSPSLHHSEQSEESSEFRKTAVVLSESDKSRIRTACEDIPHSLTPFKDWGVSCDELREDLASKRMRRFGAILRHQNAGYAFNAMVCFNIDEKRVILSDEVAKDPVKSYDLIAQAGSLLASNPHVSHCYERPSFDGFPYNVYAMMHANSAEQLDQFIADCVNALNALQSTPVEYVVLRSVRELKKTSFKFFA
ncbi:MAG: Lrp/AsnC family transcriptional regulator [Fibrobacter sp.]|nr:Lrp/AsnC family transcriptional regulator [Fibrobacter sp.]